jgi:hypothetical protein
MKTGRFMLALAAVLACLSAAPGHAQDFPTRQITLIAPWPAGGAVDALCRTLAPGLSELLGKPVVVENRPGAGSVIGTAAGAKAPPDGYTLVMGGSGSLAIGATLYKSLPYDPTKDFEPSRSSPRFHSCWSSMNPCRCGPFWNSLSMPRTILISSPMDRADRARHTIFMPNCSRA